MLENFWPALAGVVLGGVTGFAAGSAVTLWEVFRECCRHNAWRKRRWASGKKWRPADPTCYSPEGCEGRGGDSGIVAANGIYSPKSREREGWPPVDESPAF